MYWAYRRSLLFYLCVSIMNNPVRGWFLSAQTNPVYFDREDVKAAIHAPQDAHWEACPSQNTSGVFPNGDSSLPPTFTVLPNVIEKSNRTVIVQGSLDSYFIAGGTRAVLQK
jgi:carboxypeptidase D